jgi:RNA polymerase sigma factor (sigma-70 family)
MRDKAEGVSALSKAKRRIWPSAAELTRLVRLGQRGDTGALDALLTRLRPALMASLVGGMAPDDAEDATQLGLIYIAAAVGGMDPQRALPYTVAVARNLLRWARRRRAVEQGRRAPVELANALESPVTSDQEVEYKELVTAVLRHSGSTLPREQGEVVLALLSGLRPAEIAARQGQKWGTVRTRLRLARARLRVELRFYTDGLQDTEDPSPTIPRLVREDSPFRRPRIVGSGGATSRTLVVAADCGGMYRPSPGGVLIPMSSCAVANPTRVRDQIDQLRTTLL